jgi:TonB family protein
MPQGRFFRLRSSEAWSLVQKGLPQLGLAAGKTDRLNQVVLTKWRDFGAKGMDWLPAPALPSGYAASRHRFEVFVSPFAEPARVYVGSVVEVRRLGDVESRGAVYNSPTVNAALMTQIARAIGEEGVPIPSDHDQRRLVALSILGDEANECLRRGTTAAARIDRLTPPSEIAVSRFEIEYPEAASTRGEGTVEIEFAIQEDGAISDVHVPGPPSDYQFDLSAMGPVSLRLYSPARTDGCPIPVSMSYTVNYKRAP